MHTYEPNLIKVNAATARRLCEENGVPYNQYIAEGQLAIGSTGLVTMHRKGRSNYIQDLTDDKSTARRHAEPEDLQYLPPEPTAEERADELEDAHLAHIRRVLTQDAHPRSHARATQRLFDLKG